MTDATDDVLDPTAAQAAAVAPRSADSLLDVEASLSGRKWRLREAEDAAVSLIARQCQIPDALARVVAARGIPPEQAGAYLQPRLRDSFPDPSSFADMDLAAATIWDAIEAERRIALFADYDVDGATSAAQLWRWLAHFGQEAEIYIPDRVEEGYGPSAAAFETLRERGADLVVTLDCGAAAHEALKHGAGIGLDIVVIDHHLMQSAIPEAAALVNPNRPDDVSGCGHLAAAGVVFVFVAALNRLARQKKLAPEGGVLPDPMEWLDLAALGTLCDMAPLRGVNRAFVRQGLKILQRGENAGLRALADVAGIGEVNSVYHATFMLGPRLNAGGRVGDPWLAAKLLATDDREEAIVLAERLHALNDERKAIEQDILDAATAHAERQLEANPERGVLIAGGEGWHPGVIGIVAGRLKDKFHLPSIVIGWGDGLGPVAKGSARSVTGVNIGDAIAAAAREGVILSGGGHAMAGGLSCEPGQIAALDEWMCSHMHQFAEERAAAKGLMIDTLVAPGAATPELVETLATLGPFGAGAPEPVFAMRDVRCVGARRIGTNHIKFSAEDETGRIDCVAWRMADAPLGEAAIAGARLHLAGRLKLDTWNGRRRVQFEVTDAAEAR